MTDEIYLNLIGLSHKYFPQKGLSGTPLESYFFFLIQFYVPFKIISAHMRWANQ